MSIAVLLFLAGVFLSCAPKYPTLVEVSRYEVLQESTACNERGKDCYAFKIIRFPSGKDYLVFEPSWMLKLGSKRRTYMVPCDLNTLREKGRCKAEYMAPGWSTETAYINLCRGTAELDLAYPEKEKKYFAEYHEGKLRLCYHNIFYEKSGFELKKISVLNCGDWINLNPYMPACK